MEQVVYATVVFGRGNILRGDNGFGPVIIEESCAHRVFSGKVTAIDAESGSRENLFDSLLTDEGCLEQLIILDPVARNYRSSGEFPESSISSSPPLKISDISPRQLPAVNLPAELQEYTGMNKSLIIAQGDGMPVGISPALFETIKDALPVAYGMCNCSLIGVWKKRSKVFHHET